MLAKWWRRILAWQGHPVSAPRKWLPTLERLEERLTPIVGGVTVPAIVPPGGPFDGVVQVLSLEPGTGTLLANQREILTAAHVVPRPGPLGNPIALPFNVNFQLTRDDPNNPGTSINVNIPITVMPNSQIRNPNFNPNNLAAGNDIAVLVLTDQQPGMESPDRQLVAPFGAQGYSLYQVPNPDLAPANPNELNQPVTLVGYGETGLGMDGNFTDEVQQVTISNIPNGGGSFSLSVQLPNGNTINSGTLQTQGLTPEDVAQGFDDNGAAAGSIIVANAGTTPNGMVFDIRFTGAYSGTPINTLIPQVNANGPTVDVEELWTGGNTAGVKRMGQTVLTSFSSSEGPTNLQLAMNFSNVLNTVVGATKEVPVANQVTVGRGDSGGPAFIWDAAQSQWEIAGVTS